MHSSTIVYCDHDGEREYGVYTTYAVPPLQETVSMLDGFE